jgi:hypothetical protein
VGNKAETTKREVIDTVFIKIDTRERIESCEVKGRQTKGKCKKGCSWCNKEGDGMRRQRKGK